MPGGGVGRQEEDRGELQEACACYHGPGGHMHRLQMASLLTSHNCPTRPACMAVLGRYTARLQCLQGMSTCTQSPAAGHQATCCRRVMPSSKSHPQPSADPTCTCAICILCVNDQCSHVVVLSRPFARATKHVGMCFSDQVPGGDAGHAQG